ncbi:MAG: hypothetical protein ABJA79_03215 [Parafilimonas sp.]
MEIYISVKGNYEFYKSAFAVVGFVIKKYFGLMHLNFWLLHLLMKLLVGDNISRAECFHEPYSISLLMSRVSTLISVGFSAVLVFRVPSNYVIITFL